MQVTGTEVLGGGRRGESITTEVTIIVEVIRMVMDIYDDFNDSILDQCNDDDDDSVITDHDDDDKLMIANST